MKLTQSEVAGLYSQGNAHGASPLGLVVALYDTILRDLSRASEAIGQGAIEKRTFELNHALRVIAELENVLNFERGGDAAKKLKNFYGVTRGMILDAGIKNSREAVAQLWDIFATVRKAWNEGEQEMRKAAGAVDHVAQQSSEPAQAMQSQPAASASYGNADAAPRGTWSA